MYYLEFTTKFKKDFKKIKVKPNDYKKATEVLKLLQKGGVELIPVKMRPHRLKGKYSDNWECHIKPDLLVIWIQIESPNVIKLVRIGSHSDLFK